MGFKPLFSVGFDAWEPKFWTTAQNVDMTSWDRQVSEVFSLYHEIWVAFDDFFPLPTLGMRSGNVPKVQWWCNKKQGNARSIGSIAKIKKRFRFPDMTGRHRVINHRHFFLPGVGAPLLFSGWKKSSTQRWSNDFERKAPSTSHHCALCKRKKGAADHKPLGCPWYLVTRL